MRNKISILPLAIVAFASGPCYAKKGPKQNGVYKTSADGIKYTATYYIQFLPERKFKMHRVMTKRGQPANDQQAIAHLNNNISEATTYRINKTLRSLTYSGHTKTMHYLMVLPFVINKKGEIIEGKSRFGVATFIQTN